MLGAPGSRVPSPTSSSSGEGLTDAQKLQLVVRNCVQKAVELVLHSRMMPLPPHMRRGSTNRWVRRSPPPLPSSPCTRHTLSGSPSSGATGRVPPTRQRRTAPRTPTPHRTFTGVRRVQFNLESEELLTVRDELEEWRQEMAQPLQLDILLQTVRRTTLEPRTSRQGSTPPATHTPEPRLGQAGNSLMREAVGATAEEPSLVLLERWHLQYAPPPTPPGQIAWPGFYKRHMVLLRAIVGYLRLLPSHRLAQSLAKLRGDAPSLEYRLTVPSAPGLPPPPPGSAAPGDFPPSLEHSPRSYSFTPPDGMHGKLIVSVCYRPEACFRRHAHIHRIHIHICIDGGWGRPSAGMVCSCAACAW